MNLLPPRCVRSLINGIAGAVCPHRQDPPLALGDARGGLPGRSHRSRERSGGRRVVDGTDRPRRRGDGREAARFPPARPARAGAAGREVPRPGVPADHLRARLRRRRKPDPTRLRSRGMASKRSLALEPWPVAHRFREYCLQHRELCVLQEDSDDSVGFHELVKLPESKSAIDSKGSVGGRDREQAAIRDRIDPIPRGGRDVRQSREGAEGGEDSDARTEPEARQPELLSAPAFN